MHYLNESNLLIFLIQVLVLLLTAKVLGELCQRRGLPSLAGEILTGVILGPTLLGRAFPALESRLFPRDAVQMNMLDTLSWFGVLFLLLAIGFEVSVSSVWKQRKACLTIGCVAFGFAYALCAAVFWWFPPSYHGEHADATIFTLFMATAGAISAVAVIAKVLHDMDILKSDLGLTTLSSLIVSDVLGWMAFALVLGLVAPAEGHSTDLSRMFFEIVMFITVCLTIGSKVVGGITSWLHQTSLPQPGTTLTFICCLGLFCGAITQWIGIHAILGFFLAGIMAGNAPEISENNRQIIAQMIHAIFVPLFFAVIGIKLDFFQSFDIWLVLVVTSVNIGGKFIGAWLGARLAGLPKSDSLSIGMANIPGGATEIILGIIALEMKIIPENVFVAIIFAALPSSIAVGPLLTWSLRRREAIDVRSMLSRSAMSLDLKGKTRWDIIEELGKRIANSALHLDAQEVISAVIAREHLMGTGLEKGVAVPHARLGSLDHPVVVFGRSRNGIDWDARDGQPAHYVFLILTPQQEEGMQVQILAAIAKTMLQRDIAARLMASDDEDEIFQTLNQALGLEQLEFKKRERRAPRVQPERNIRPAK